jgi:hypothetical protein
MQHSVAARVGFYRHSVVLLALTVVRGVPF